MTKKEMARIIINSKGWNGTNDISILSRETKETLKEIMQMCEDYEKGYEYMI